MNEEIYENLIDKYISERKEFIDKTWYSIPSFLKRICCKEKWFIELRKKDMVFQKGVEYWLSGYIPSQDISLNELKNYKHYLKNHSSKLKLRTSYLTLALGLILFLLSTVFLKHMLSIINSADGIEQFIFMIIFFLIFGVLIIAFVEQINISEYETAYHEIINILDKIMDNWDVKTNEPTAAETSGYPKV